MKETPMKKRIFCVLLCFSMLGTLLGCSNVDDTGNELYDELSQYYQSSDSGKKEPVLTAFALPYLQGLTLDPLTCLDGTQQDIGQLLYEGLVALDQSFTPQPVLAESWSYDAGSFTWAIRLRSGISFSDGSALTASDVVSTLQRARSVPRYQGRMAQVSSISAAGSETVVIRLSRANASFISLLDIPVVKTGTETNTVPTGTGRYIFVETSGTDKAHLVKNDSWWQQKALPLARIELHACKDSDTISYAFYAREVQLLWQDLTASDAASAAGSGTYTDADTTTLQYLGFNTSRAPFDNAALRRAVSLGIDRAGCVQSFLTGHGRATQFPISPASNLYPNDLETGYSPDHFNQAMAALGYEAPVAVTLLVNSENSHKVDMAGKIAAALSDSALQVTMKALPFDQFQSALQAGNFDLYLGECRMTADWDLTELLSGSLNYGRYQSPEFTAALQSERTAEGSAHEQAAAELYALLLEQCPIAPICFKSSTILLTPGAVDAITPTLNDPFFAMERWKVHIS